MLATVELLREHGACGPGLAVFEREWPRGAEVREANLLRAAALGLSIVWFGEHCLPEALQAEYQRQAASLRAEYKRQVASLITRLVE